MGVNVMDLARYFDEHCVCDCSDNSNQHVIADHRDGILVLAAMTDEKPEQRPSCGYRERVKPDGPKQPCGSEERLFNVTGRGTWGNPKQTPVCPRHLEKAWKDWNVEKAEPLDVVGKKLG